MVKLLIADDEYVIRSGLESLDWESIGVEVCAVAENGPDALKKILATSPGIILSDIKMPGISGIELAHECRKHDQNGLFIFFTGHSEFNLVKEALVAEAFDYILKPSTPEAIFECVQRAVNKIDVGKRVKISEGEFDDTVEGCDIGVFFDVRDEQTAKILDFIKENYAGDCTLRQVSKSLNYSPVHLNRILRKNTPYTFHELLMIMRLFKACRYLIDTKMPILNVAENVGIGDQRYFSQVFKRTFGMTPGQYRKTKSGEV